MYFKSKKDWWLGFILFASIIVILFGVFIENNIEDSFPAIPIVGLLIWIWCGTGYTFLENNKLRITCGPLRGTVDIDKIEYVKSTNVPWSSAALSLDRLLIRSNQGLWNRAWYVSPKEKEKFIEELKKRNPNIKFEIQ